MGWGGGKLAFFCQLESQALLYEHKDVPVLARILSRGKLHILQRQILFIKKMAEKEQVAYPLQTRCLRRAAATNIALPFIGTMATHVVFWYPRSEVLSISIAN